MDTKFYVMEMPRRDVISYAADNLCSLQAPIPKVWGRAPRSGYFPVNNCLNLGAKFPGGRYPGLHVRALFRVLCGRCSDALRALFGVHYGRCSGCSSGAHSDKGTLPNLRQIRKVPVYDLASHTSHLGSSTELAAPLEITGRNCSPGCPVRNTMEKPSRFGRDRCNWSNGGVM